MKEKIDCLVIYELILMLLKLIVCCVIKKEIFVVKLIWFDDMIFKKVCNIFFFIYSLFSWRLI